MGSLLVTSILNKSQHSTPSSSSHSHSEKHNSTIQQLIDQFNSAAPHLLNEYQLNVRNDITHHQDPCCFGIYCMDSRCGQDVALQGHLPGVQTFITTPAALYNFGDGSSSASEFASVAFFLGNYNIDSVVIVPHTKCGAATAAFNYFKNGKEPPVGIAEWIKEKVPKDVVMRCNSPDELSREIGKITKESVLKVIEKINVNREKKINVPISVWIHDLDEYKIKPVE